MKRLLRLPKHRHTQTQCVYCLIDAIEGLGSTVSTESKQFDWPPSSSSFASFLSFASSNWPLRRRLIDNWCSSSHCSTRSLAPVVDPIVDPRRQFLIDTNGDSSGEVVVDSSTGSTFNLQKVKQVSDVCLWKAGRHFCRLWLWCKLASVSSACCLCCCCQSPHPFQQQPIWRHFSSS